MVVVQPTKKGEKMWTDNLRQFHFWCQKTLPLVYDDSLSYYEVLAKVTKHLNELTTLVNEIGDELERYEGVTDNRLDTLETWRTEVDTWRAQIDQWRTIVENWREDVDTWISQTDDWKQSTENHLTAHDNWISYATNLINNTIVPFIEDMTTRVSDIESAITGLEDRIDTAEDDIDTLQSDVTSLDSRLDDAESSIAGLDSRLDTAEGDIGDIQDDVTNLQNRMSTAETNLLGLNKALRLIPINVNYDSSELKYKAYCRDSYDASYIKNNLTAAAISGSVFGYGVRFLAHFDSYDFSNIYLYDENGNIIKYSGDDAYISVAHISDGVITNDIDSRHLYILDTSWSSAHFYRIAGNNVGELPRPNPSNPSGDDGKVVAYNYATKNYELITPSGGSSHTYSTTEHEVGVWIDGTTKVYEKSYTGVSTSPLYDVDTFTSPSTVRILSMSLSNLGEWSGANELYINNCGSGTDRTYLKYDTSTGKLSVGIPAAATSVPTRFWLTIRYIK